MISPPQLESHALAPGLEASLKVFGVNELSFAADGH